MWFGGFFPTPALPFASGKGQAAIDFMAGLKDEFIKF
jgi:hypothetical protein